MDFITALKAAKQKGRNVVIPDIKCYSPKEGDLLAGRNPRDIAETLVNAGAPVLSVVTEERNFKGSKHILQEIASLGVPVLRKDFLGTKADIHETKLLGASAVLLMYSCLNEGTLRELYTEAKSIGLDVLVETHNAEELKKATLLGAELIGINNRDIGVLERDDGTVSLTERLAGQKPGGSFLISESSIRSSEDVRRAIRSGADAALVGTALLKAEDLAAFYQKLCRPVRVKLCGMMSARDIKICSPADILGFVAEYPERIPWNLSAQRAKELLHQVPSSCRSCIVTGGSPDKVISLAKELRPDYIQLHHKENTEQTRNIVSEVSRLGIKVIRSIPCSEQKLREQFGTDSPYELSELFAGMGVSELLADSRYAENAGNSDAEAPIGMFGKLKSCSPIPVMLAGGITPYNVRRVISESGADRIDIMTGIEESPGVKSSDAVNELFRQIGG